jgi:serine protease Do
MSKKMKITSIQKIFSCYLFVMFVFCGTPLQASTTTLPDFTVLIEKYGPAVVNISSIQKAKSQGSNSRAQAQDVPDVLRYFFGEGFNYPQQDKTFLGSGFIISQDGYILTNFHVIRNADQVVVRLLDRRELTAKVIGGDEKSDLALLKIQADNLPVVKLGTSSKLKVGEWVLAIGSPYGFEATATKGIVSHLGRSLPNANYVPFIQTDVPINPGNSGGPLFNLKGEVVGINSQIYSGTGGFMGLSFAIPIDTVMSVVSQIKEHGKVQRGWLGVVIQEVNRDLADSFGLEKPAGALVAKVIENGPGAAAGLREGDVILKFGGKDVAMSSDLPIFVGNTAINTLVDVVVLREGKKRSVKARVGALPEEDQPLQKKVVNALSTDRLGLIVGDITREQSERWQVTLGVAVREVLDDPARSAGIQPGDIITQINNREVDSIESYQRVLQSLNPDKWVPVLVYRRGKPIFIPLYIPAE